MRTRRTRRSLAAGFAAALAAGTVGVTAAAAQPGPPGHAGPPAHAGGPPAHAGPPAADEAQEDYEVLVVGKTKGFRHGSIVDATHAIIALGEQHGFSVDVWDPPNDYGGWWGDGSPGQPDLSLEETPFTSAEDLERYATIVFKSPVDNTNDQDPDNPRLLDDDELEAFQGYIRNGGGFAGIHAATDTMHNVPWYSELTGGGARFISHPPIQTATKWVEDPTHPSTEMLPIEWERTDEWYNFSTNPREDVHVLINLDESTFEQDANAMGEDHPIAWCHNFEGARSWYTAGGHVPEAFDEDDPFLAHVLGGIEWTAGVVGDEGDCTTYDEVRDILDGISTDHPRDRNAVRNITRHLDRAQDSADAGDHGAAARSLRTAGNLARALPTDADVSDGLTVRLAGLAEREAAAG